MFKIIFFIVLILSQVLFAQDLPKKVFYIDASFEIDKEMKWEEIGVGNETAFTDVIKKSWKVWAEKNFKNFDQVEVSAPPTDTTFLHKNTAVLKWTSLITKKDFDDYQLSAQYILLTPKENDVLLSYTFPDQKILIDFSIKKEAGSKLASLIYNLLNSQTVKFKALQIKIQEASTSVALVISYKGKISLSEMLAVKNQLETQFKNTNITVDLKNYSFNEGAFFVKANVSEENLMSQFQQAGKIPLNEQKILIFNTQDKSFAILPKEQNNEVRPVPQ